MAVFNGVEGMAHAELASDASAWSGYIVVAYGPLYKQVWSMTGSSWPCVYHGPVCSHGKYHRAYGRVRVTRYVVSGGRVTLFFEGLEAPSLLEVFQGRPADFLD